MDATRRGGVVVRPEPNHVRPQGPRLRREPTALDTVGVDVSRVRYAAAALSGVPPASAAPRWRSTRTVHRERPDDGQRQGFIAIVAYLFGNYNPVGALRSTTLFAGLDAVQLRLQTADVIAVPDSLVQTIPFVAVIVVLALVGMTRLPEAAGDRYESGEEDLSTFSGLGSPAAVDRMRSPDSPAVSVRDSLSVEQLFVFGNRRVPRPLDRRSGGACASGFAETAAPSVPPVDGGPYLLRVTARRELGTYGRMNPPLRSEDRSEAPESAGRERRSRGQSDAARPMTVRGFLAVTPLLTRLPACSSRTRMCAASTGRDSKCRADMTTLGFRSTGSRPGSERAFSNARPTLRTRRTCWECFPTPPARCIWDTSETTPLPTRTPGIGGWPVTRCFTRWGGTPSACRRRTRPTNGTLTPNPGPEPVSTR